MDVEVRIVSRNYRVGEEFGKRNFAFALLAAPLVAHQIGRDPEKIAPSMAPVFWDQLGTKEAAIRVLQQVLGQRAFSGGVEQVGKQCRGRLLVKRAKSRRLHAQLALGDGRGTLIRHRLGDLQVQSRNGQLPKQCLSPYESQ